MTSGVNVLWNQPNSSLRYAVGDSVEGNARNLLVKNAIPFVSAKDPRVPARYVIASNGRDTTKSQDGKTFARTTSLWARLTNVPVVNGLDARLIEAEAKLKAGDIPGMISILNALRGAPPKLGEIQVPATGTARSPRSPRRRRSAPPRTCTSARRHSGRSAAASDWATCAVSFGSMDARRTRSSQSVSITAGGTMGRTSTSRSRRPRRTTRS